MSKDHWLDTGINAGIPFVGSSAHTNEYSLGVLKIVFLFLFGVYGFFKEMLWKFSIFLMNVVQIAE